MKEKMSLEKKTKLFYSGELILIALIVLVIGILKLVGVIGTNTTRLLVYNIITIIGATFVIGDLCWAVFSSTRRAKVSMLDKLLALPVGLYLIPFDIICFVKGEAVDNTFVVYSVGLVLIYVAVIYIFEGIYHYYHLTPQLQQAIEEELKKQEEDNNIDVNSVSQDVDDSEEK